MTVASAGELAPFVNEPVLDLRRPASRDTLLAALGELERRLPIEVPVLVGGERGSATGIDSTDPGSPDRLVARAGIATETDVDEAVALAAAAGRDWGRRPASERAATLDRAAAILRERRAELAALEVRACAKPWPEADADVCEAIDFLRYYGRQGVELARGPELAQPPGERNEMRYVPRGVVAVISPWNFPIAIPAGMTAGALAAGNAVLLKPAEQSPACALALVEVMHEAGVPPGALALLPGYGETGAALVRHPGVHAIAFTGSSAVGLEIMREASIVHDRQDHVKRVVAEMGGKNCVIVDADADLDEAVPAIVRSAFDYAGQKCSACARVLAHEALCGRLLDRLAGAVEVLHVGQAEELATDIPPLIEQAARERVTGYREIAERTGRLAAEAPGQLPAGGWFSSPAVATDLPADSPLLHEEIFGPLVTVEPVASVEQACEIVESLPFALTGGLFSRDPRTVATVAARLPVGNLYVNRHITHAMVGRQPFGGNKLSGIGAKAGGPGYLLEFTEPRAVCENTMRHGLVA